MTQKTLAQIPSRDRVKKRKLSARELFVIGIITGGILLGAAVIMPSVTHAQVSIKIETIKDVERIINQIIGVMQAILFSIAGIFVVIAGYHFLVAQGDADKTVQARHMILYAIYAIGAGLLATFLSTLVQNLLVGA